jgi:hypothetical protein
MMTMNAKPEEEAETEPHKSKGRKSDVEVITLVEM